MQGDDTHGAGPPPLPADAAGQQERICGWSVDLQAPTSIARAIAVVGKTHEMYRTQDNEALIFCLVAALGICWPRLQRNTRAPRWNGQVLAYGERLTDFLLAGGAPLEAILRAGKRSVPLCEGVVPSPEAIDENRDFSGQSQDGSSESSSPSNGTGIRGLVGSLPSPVPKETG